MIDYETPYMLMTALTGDEFAHPEPEGYRLRVVGENGLGKMIPWAAEPRF